MRILAIYKHFWPDTTPYARILRSMLSEFTLHGHEADVFSAQPSYNGTHLPKQPSSERLGLVSVYRCGLPREQGPARKTNRVINQIFFILKAIYFAITRKERYDLIIANSHPPVLMSSSLRLIKALTGTPYLLHYQDIHPEGAHLIGDIRSRLVLKVATALDAAACREAAAIVTLSTDMRRTLKQRGINRRIDVINNFPLDRYTSPGPLPHPFNDSPLETTPFRVLFAGNMGRYQRLELLIDAAAILRDRHDIQFVFLGSGTQMSRLQSRAGAMLDQTVYFVPQQPVEVAFACMQRSDLGVVSLAENIARVSYPSKAITYLDAGCRVLAICEQESSLWADIVDAGFGIGPVRVDAESIAQAIERASRIRLAGQTVCREMIRERSSKQFGRDQAIFRWLRLLNSLQLQEELQTFDQAHSRRKCA